MMKCGQVNRVSVMEVVFGVGLVEDVFLVVMVIDEVGQIIEEVYILVNCFGLIGMLFYVVGDEVIMGVVGYDQFKLCFVVVKDCG